ncbi:MAG: acyltransferase [Verrucomicrobiota bacterium]|nr:acyltransferase [Verrucomicrobiota bacterium]
MTSRPTAAGRLAHIDSLRAVAALMVACAHVWEMFLPFTPQSARANSQTWPRYFDFGITGVVLFFAISGFVIYGTLKGPREDAGRRFIITRFFRLYPAYWVSIVAGLIFIWWWQNQPVTGAMVAANATMLPTVLGQPQVMGLYWTLETELAFYLSCWLIWRIGYLNDARFLAWLVVGMSLAWFAVKGAKQLGVVPDDINGGWKNLPRHLGIMFWGAYFRIVYDQTRGFREAIRSNRKFWMLVGLTLVILSVGGTRQFRFFIHPDRNWFSPYVVAPLLFWIWVAWLRVRARPIAWLGQISYSIYLFHLIVAAPLVCWVALSGNTYFRGWPIACYLIPVLLLTIAVSAGVYYAVEWPAIALGKRLAGTRAKGDGIQAAP